MPRSLWKGAISFGLVHIPVVLYSAEDRNSFDLTMLDRRDMKPVGFKRYNKETGKDVPWEEIVKGYEYEKERYVVLTDEDFRRANIEATQTVDIISFVDASEISSTYFETPYYLAPDKRGEKGYALLRETLKKTGKIAMAQVVIRTRQYVCALIPDTDVIVLNTLRYANELKSTKDIAVPIGNRKAVGVSPREVEMATKLVEEMTEAWDPKKFKDTYHGDLMQLIEKRIKSGQTEVVEEPEAVGESRRPAEVIDLMALLKKSVQAKERTQEHAGPSKRPVSRHDRSSRRKSA